MNRTIKFKGIKKSDKKWIIGDLNHIDGKVYILDRQTDGDNMNSPDDYEVIPETVGQFTGLIDKNEKYIYEGDLLNIGASEFGFVTDQNSERANYEVKTIGCDTILYRIDLKLNWGNLSRLDELGWECQVAGNIYDNKELINQ
jgi:uncharacterized phage protein (TIGR01671 family)